MTEQRMQRIKVALGLLLGLAIGAGCRLLEIPSPAPPVLAGALLVVAMTAGYATADRWMVSRAARLQPLCGGPDGSTRAERGTRAGSGTDRDGDAATNRPKEATTPASSSRGA